ncbi:MAG: hypothetical protein IID38_12700 [Planctomycetes bacterium]|nr:hypothetical protein [Planctomycetota bacterium]
MKRLAVGLGTGVVLAGALVCLSAALTGCGTIALQDLLGENTCLILNCDKLFFLDEVEHDDIDATDTSDDHDDMDMEDDHDGMDATEADDDHDDLDEGDDHADEEHDEDAMPEHEQ